MQRKWNIIIIITEILYKSCTMFLLHYLFVYIIFIFCIFNSYFQLCNYSRNVRKFNHFHSENCHFNKIQMKHKSLLLKIRKMKNKIFSTTSQWIWIHLFSKWQFFISFHFSWIIFPFLIFSVCSKKERKEQNKKC